MHLQRSIGDIGSAFAPVEDAISSCFLPALLGKDPDTPTPTDLRKLLSLPVKFSGIGVPDPTASADNHNATSTECTSLLTTSLLGQTTFNLADHKSTMKQGRSAAKLSSISRSASSFTALTTDMPKLRLQKITRNKETGAWLNIIPTVVNGMSLSKMEFRDGFRMRYGIGLEDLPHKCDGCGAKFSIEHALARKQGGLGVGRHDEIKDEIAELATMATSSNRVRNEPIIKIGRDTNGKGVPSKANVDCLRANPPTEKTIERGDVLVHGLYDRHTSCIIDVRVTDTDQPSYLTSTPAKAIAKQEKAKKQQYLESCLEQRRHFAPYVVDTYGLLGEEAKAFNKRIGLMLAEKWKSPYSAVMGFVNARVSVAILRASHLCLRGSRVPYRHISTKRSNWDDGAGLGMFQTTA